MQTLWTRIAHVRSHCICPQCHPSRWSTSTSSRRVTTSTPRWRLLKPIHSATFFYSAVFASAAVVDGGAKKQRRLELDNAIAEARRELGNDTATDDGLAEHMRYAEYPPSITIETRLDGNAGTSKEYEEPWNERWETAPEPMRSSENTLRIKSTISNHAHISDGLRPFVEHWTENGAGSAQFRNHLNKTLHSGKNGVDADFSHPYSWLDRKHRTMFRDGWVLQSMGIDTRAVKALNALVVENGNDQVDLDFVRDHQPVAGAPWPRLDGATSWRIRRRDFHFGPESIWSQGIDRRKVLDNPPWADRKLSILDVSVGAMICKLLLSCGCWTDVTEHIRRLGVSTLRSYSKTGEAKLGSTLLELQDILKRLRFRPDQRSSYPTPRVPLPYFKHSPDGSHHEVVVEVNELLERALRDFKDDKISLPEVVIRVTEVFLSSPVPPNITSYNLLLAAFNSPEHSSLFNTVLTSALETRQHVNEVTRSLVFDHFSMMNEPVKFWYFYRLTKGELGGLEVFKLPAGKISEYTQVARWSGESPSKAVAVMRPDPLVLQQMVRGMLRFMNMNAVYQWWHTITPGQVRKNRESFRLMLRKCVVYRDWERGRWAFSSLVDSFLKENGGRPCSETYFLMLSLCQMCDMKDEFRVLLDQMVASGLCAQTAATRVAQFCKSIVDVYDKHRIRTDKKEVSSQARAVKPNRIQLRTQEARNHPTHTKMKTYVSVYPDREALEDVMEDTPMSQMAAAPALQAAS
ncbi:hypothetical protein P152DRAFT_95905 [Eremomyces bilateralis CBS 781.70]|uniref:Uncharacterized protein n=1 Tax=Eremomyces bilateralis CBS 781.70 TaxID=1392243 RepID=A0A6G1FX36_9PEZI|nr:uncharacterized protein P152DRAFT_95905 [Eremomyces bilateralis CBS 781.70]KAF1810353.1 hypothetical protein P152DRAFT_95905 [Eremomyces bilateralis CBS 781.70]